MVDNGVLSAYDARTGRRFYQQRLARDAGGFSASPVAAAGRVYLPSEDGVMFVVRAGRTYALLARNDMKEMLLATPAIVGDTLFVRTRTHLVALSGAPGEPRRPRADDSESWASGALDAVDVALAADQQPALRRRERGVDRLVELVGAHDLVRRAGLHHERVAVGAGQIAGCRRTPPARRRTWPAPADARLRTSPRRSSRRGRSAARRPRSGRRSRRRGSATGCTSVPFS